MFFYYELKIETNTKRSLKFLSKLLNKSLLKKEIFLPKKEKLFVILKSPHVNKKAKEHFKLFKHSRLFFVYFSQTTLCSFLRRIPNDIIFRIRKIESQYV